MTDQRLRWYQVRWGLAGRGIARIAVVSGKVFGVLGSVAAVVFAIFYLMWPWLVARHMDKFDPRLSTIPVSVTSRGEADLSNERVDCCGFTMLLPHGVVRRFGYASDAVVIFGNGQLLEIEPTSQDKGIFLFARFDKSAKKLITPQVLQSRFKLMQASMFATPKQVEWWRFRSSENERVNCLLTLKFGALLQFHSLHSENAPIYTIAHGDYHGFQLGSPSIAPYDVHLDLFDSADRYFAFEVTTGPNSSGQLLTQEEINAMVASIRPVSNR